jgi:hypothetical protein
MNIPSKEDTIKKWAPILERMGMTGSKAECMSEYVEIHSKNESLSDFPTLLPIAKQIFAKTVGLDIVPVMPFGGGNSGPEMETIRQDVKIENRDRKIESIVEDKEFEEMKVEDHPDYKESVGPRGNLFYLDFQYGGTESNTIL